MLRPLDVDLSPEDRSLAAVARTRALGLHTLAHFAGVVGESPAPGAGRLELHPPTWSGDGAAGSPTELALLADLALGTALRSALGPGLRLGTISLTVEHLRRPRPGVLHAEADAGRVDHDAMDGQGHVLVHDTDGHRVAQASGWFVALPVPDDGPLPPVPWEDAGAEEPELTVQDLTALEREVHDELTGAATPHGDVVARLTAAPVGLVSEGEQCDALDYELPTGPALGNRVRQVQGGAQYGAAAEAARAVAGPGWEVATGHVQFLRPIAEPRTAVAARVTRRGRRVVFAEVTLAAAGRTALAGRFSLRPVAG